METDLPLMSLGGVLSSKLSTTLQPLSDRVSDKTEEYYKFYCTKTEEYYKFYSSIVDERIPEYEQKFTALVDAYLNTNSEDDWDFEKFRQILHRPYVALPTLGLAFAVVLLWTFSLLLGTGWILPEGYHAYPLFTFGMLTAARYPACSLFISVPLALLCMAMSSVASYAAFTVMHDAVHRALSKNRWFNDMIGRFASLFFGPLSNYNMMRIVHLEHHKYTNDPHRDPDMFASAHGPGGAWLMPLRWLFVDVGYLWHLLPSINPLRPKVTNKELMVIWVDFLTNIALMAFFCHAGCGVELLHYWVVPSRFAMMFLAFAFDYLPHAPHETTRTDDRYHTTSYLSSSFLVRPFLGLLLFYQNYHIMHHLYPTVPFYRTPLLWQGERNKLMKDKQVHVTRLFRCFGREYLPKAEGGGEGEGEGECEAATKLPAGKRADRRKSSIAFNPRAASPSQSPASPPSPTSGKTQKVE